MSNSYKATNNETSRQAMINKGCLLLDALDQHDTKFHIESHTNPLVSIVIISYNAPELLAITLFSLVGLHCFNKTKFEVIIIDNNSKSSTISLLSRVTGAKIERLSTNIGFGPACNYGATIAKSEYILFLNPDIELLPSSLDALVSAHISSDSIGAVGGRLIFPGGELQEAGAVFLDDHQFTYPYMRGEGNPRTSEVAFRRPVGYVSGALLLIKKRLFDELNGFDRAFSPAYFEDTDLCVRISRAGLDIIYEPTAVAIHFESATSANRSNVEALLDLHRKKFKSRHSKWLAAPSFSQIRSMLEVRSFKNFELRILYIDDEVPHVDSGAGMPRSNSIINMMAKLGYFITIYPLHRGDVVYRDKYRDLPKTVEILGGDQGKHLNEVISDRIKYYDVLWISRPHNIDIVSDIFRDLKMSMWDFVKSLVVFDAEAVFAIREHIQSVVLGRRVIGSSFRRAVSAEIRNYYQAGIVCCVSKQEQRVFEGLGFTNTKSLGHVVEIKDHTPGFKARKGLVFVGSLLYPDTPNYDSIQWFLENVWDSIQQEINDVIQLTIVGAVSDSVRQDLMRPGVVFVGRVKNIDRYLDAARVAIAPTRFAAGIPHKVHETTSRGLPSIISPLLAQQLGWPDGVGYVVGEWKKPELFTQSIVGLYSNEALWTDVRNRGLNAAQEDCASDLFEKSVRDICEAGFFADL